MDTNVSQALAALSNSGTAEAAPGTDVDLRRLILVVWRAKWLMALLAILGVGIAYAQLIRITPLYTAESRVLWEVDQTNVAGLDPIAQGLANDFFSLSSQIEVIKSGRLLNRVVTDLKLAEDPVFKGSLGVPEGWTRWLSLSNI
ncbi:MAG: Wzz/FepE/Etk N-terminal domain-containing protein, partial [Planctomycetales bacterium]